MRRSKFWLSSICLALVLLVCTSTGSRAQSRYTASYQDFYDGLSPYGQWIQDAQYGYVWLPDVADDFRPYYTNGYWANTQYGNTWVSGYDWGWAPFHYGRWTYDNYYGWLWIPDTEWAPAWVSWRSSNDYYGWAPMGPGININLNLGRIPVDWWVFITPGYFYDRSFYRYCDNDYGFRRGVYSRTSIINYTYIDNRTTYYTGPRGDDYYQHTGRRPSMFNIDNNNRRGATRVKGDRISVYRPDIRNTAGAAPTNVARTDRAVTRRPQVFNGTAAGASGRELLLGDSRANAGPSSGRTQRMNEIPSSSVRQSATIREQGNLQVPQQRNNGQSQRAQQNNIPVQEQRRQQNATVDPQRNMQAQQQRDAQVEQQRAQQAQQRDMQAQQQRMMQQQRDAQIQQQRNTQMDQQRAQQAQQRDMQVQQQRMMQQQRDAQIQQQRNTQMEQQRAQQAQQRDMQVQQQRMMQQQRDAQIQQQRNTQMEQQRAQQAQQRDMQMQQQRTQQAQPVQRQEESPMRMRRDGSR